MTVFTYDQTSASVPGLVVRADYALDGPVPTVSSCRFPPCTTPDFGPLTAFHIDSPAGSFSLANFVNPTNPLSWAYPQWSIDPLGISFIDAGDAADFRLSFSGRIQVESDWAFPICGTTGQCATQGTFVAASTAAAADEPSSLLFGVALVLAAVVRKRVARS